MSNYFDNFLNFGLEDEEFLPMYMIPQRYFNCLTEGFGEIVLEEDNEELNKALVLVKTQLETLYDLYKKDYIFTQPQMVFQPTSPNATSRIGLKVGMMTRERYEEIKKRFDGSDKPRDEASAY